MRVLRANTLSFAQARDDCSDEHEHERDGEDHCVNGQDGGDVMAQNGEGPRPELLADDVAVGQPVLKSCDSCLKGPVSSLRRR